MSRASRAMVRGPAWSTSSPGRLELGSEVPQGSPAFPGDSRSGRWPTCRPALLGDSGPCLRACRLDQMSRPTWGRAPVPAGLTSSPGRLGPRSDGPRGRQVLPSDSCVGPCAHGVDQFPQVTRAWAECRGVARFPGQLALGSEGPPFDKNSRVTRVRFFFPTESTTCPARLTPASEAPGGLPAVLSILGQCPSARVFRPALPGDTCLGGTAHGVDQHSRRPRARVRLPARST